MAIKTRCGHISDLTARAFVYRLKHVVLRFLTCYLLVLTVLFGGIRSAQALPATPWADASEEDDEAPASHDEQEAADRIKESALKNSPPRRHLMRLPAPIAFRDLPRPAPAPSLPLPRMVQPALPCFQPRLQL